MKTVIKDTDYVYASTRIRSSEGRGTFAERLSAYAEAGSAEELGKNPGKDADQNKMTWVALRGAEGTAEDACRETELALDALRKLPWDTEFFKAFTESLPGRKT